MDVLLLDRVNFMFRYGAGAALGKVGAAGTAGTGGVGLGVGGAGAGGSVGLAHQSKSIHTGVLLEVSLVDKSTLTGDPELDSHLADVPVRGHDSNRGHQASDRH